VVECPHCGQTLDPQGVAAGQRITCPVCVHSFVFGAQSTPAPSTDSQSAPTPWHVTTPDGHRYGPCANDVIIGWIQDGRLAAGSCVWCQGMTGWAPIESTPPFSQYFLGIAATDAAGQRARRPDEAYCGNCRALISREAVICVSCGVATGRGAGKFASGLISKSVSWPVVAGAGIVLISFFLPWVDLGIISVAGYQIPSKVSALSGLASSLSQAPPGASGSLTFIYFLYIVPVLGLDPMYTQLTSSPGRNAHAAVCALTIFGILALNFGRAFVNDSPNGPSVFNFLAIGFYGTVFGALAMFFGALTGTKRR